MKTKTFITLLLVFLSINLWSQKTLVITTDSINGKDADLASISPDANYGQLNRFRADTWTYSGDLVTLRAVFAFNLTEIAPHSKIVSAILSLYHDADLDNSALSGSNACWLQRITSPWSEKTVTWNTQPSTSTENQAVIDSSSAPDKDYPSIDVTALVQDMINKPDSSFGFMIRQQTEEPYRRLNFASSENIDSLKRPKLTIHYYDCEVIDTIRIAVTDTLIIDVTLSGISDYDYSHNYNKIKVFPNPTKDKIYIDNGNYETMNNYRIKIINTQSVTVFNSLVNQQTFEIDMNKFGAKGLYFIQLYDDSNNLIDVRKIILR